MDIEHEKKLAPKATYYAANRDRVKASQAAYYAANAGKIKAYQAAYQAAYRAANAEEIKASAAAYYAANAKKIKARAAAYQPAYRAANPEKVKASAAAYHAANREKALARMAAYRARNPEKVKAQRAAWESAKYRTDPNFRIAMAIRNHLHRIVKSGGVKDATSLSYVGCTAAELRRHLEKQFTTGMTWLNHGEWHIDHIVPLAAFDFAGFPAQIKQAQHYTNLRPMWAKDNQRKSDTLLHPVQLELIAVWPRCNFSN